MSSSDEETFEMRNEKRHYLHLREELASQWDSSYQQAMGNISREAEQLYQRRMRAADETQQLIRFEAFNANKVVLLTRSLTLLLNAPSPPGGSIIAR